MRRDKGKPLSAEIRAAYELRPYPAVTRAALRRPPWYLPPPEWIASVAQPTPFPPRRILIAGCGTGLEAFAFRQRFPEAEIVGVDFAARPIREAQRLQQRAPANRSIRFLRADLTSDRLPEITGGNFDFISCHGVMSYLPAPARALRQLARCLAPEGLLYLGVNGAMHFSANWRRFLPAFDFELARWPGGARLWRHLRFTAALVGDAEGEQLRHGANHLASDLFGAVIRNLPLADWVRMGRRAGLHFRDHHGAVQLVRPAINQDSDELFLPRSRAEVAQLLDLLRPRRFYQMVFTRQPEATPPWRKMRELLQWRPRRTELLRGCRWQRSGARFVRLESRAANLAIELRDAGWEIRLLRESDGQRPLRKILAPVVPSIAPAALRAQLYRFYLLDLLDLRPPLAAKKEVRAPSRQRRERSPRRIR